MDLCATPAVDLARLIRSRQLSAAELLEAVLARIEAVNPSVNAPAVTAAAALPARGRRRTAVHSGYAREQATADRNTRGSGRSAPDYATGPRRPDREAAMAQETQFTFGARASCTDGHCGEVRRLIIDPATDIVTHLVIQPGHNEVAGRLVPVHLVETTDGGIRLRCTLAEFDKLDHAAERDMVTGAEPAQISGRFGTSACPGPGAWGQTAIVEDVIPVGEDEVGPGDPVHAVDGAIGRVQGFRVNPGDDRVTHVLLQEGHLWGRKKVAIPISAVTGVDYVGIRLNLTKEQVGELPSVDIDHPG